MADVDDGAAAAAINTLSLLFVVVLLQSAEVTAVRSNTNSTRKPMDTVAVDADVVFDDDDDCDADNDADDLLRRPPKLVEQLNNIISPDQRFLGFK